MQRTNLATKCHMKLLPKKKGKGLADVKEPKEGNDETEVQEDIEQLSYDDDLKILFYKEFKMTIIIIEGFIDAGCVEMSVRNVDASAIDNFKSICEGYREYIETNKDSFSLEEIKEYRQNIYGWLLGYLGSYSRHAVEKINISLGNGCKQKMHY